MMLLMHEDDPESPRKVPASESFETMRARATGTNVNPNTLLATDYLNHFNEIVMMLEMVPDMPEILEECAAWQPRDYKAHFAQSHVADKDLAIAAYDYVPERFRVPFEATVDQTNTVIARAVETLAAEAASGHDDGLRLKTAQYSQSIQRLLDVASGIIHGSEKTLSQADIDMMLGE